MSLRRIDVRFLLPRAPQTALVLGDLSGWREGLAEVGVELLTADGHEAADLVVAPATLASRALASGAEMIVLEGRMKLPPGADARSVQRLLARPSVHEPALLLPVDDPISSSYAVERWSVMDRSWKKARVLIALELLRRGRFPSLGASVTVAVRRARPPYLVAAAQDHLDLPQGVRALLALGMGDALSRNIFHIFPQGSPQPAWVLKFARVPGYAEPFERDERGLDMAAHAGGPVAARAPRLIGRFDHDGTHASLETAAPGIRLRDLLLRPGHHELKIKHLGRVADWILDLARSTSTGPEGLADERRRLDEEVVPRWRVSGASPDLVASLPPLPAVIQHNDLGSWNIVVDPGDFTVLDWESARERGLPLWDLFYFLADALAMLDGSTSGDERHVHTMRLFRGELPSSAILFAWVRRAVAALDVPVEAVGKIATLCWLHHSLSHVHRSGLLASYTDGSEGPIHGTEHVAGAWLADPFLGEGWDRWREGTARHGAR